MRFKDLPTGHKFVFVDQPSGEPRPCEKTDEREYVVLDTGARGRVGVGDNPVIDYVPGELRRAIESTEPGMRKVADQ